MNHLLVTSVLWVFFLFSSCLMEWGVGMVGHFWLISETDILGKVKYLQNSCLEHPTADLWGEPAACGFLFGLLFPNDASVQSGHFHLLRTKLQNAACSLVQRGLWILHSGIFPGPMHYNHVFGVARASPSGLQQGNFFSRTINEESRFTPVKSRNTNPDK